MASAALASTGFVSYGRTRPAKNVREANIRWAMGWILWRNFRGLKVPLPEAINMMAELGLDGVEYTPQKDELSRFGLTRESFRDLLAEKKLSVAANYFGGDFHNSAKHEEILSAFNSTLENVKFYGAKNVVIGPPGRGNWTDYHHSTSSGREMEITDKIKAMAPFLNKLGKIAKDSGIEIGLHPHVNTIVETPEEIDLIMDLTDPNYLGMAPDTGHIQLGGGDAVAIIKKYSSRLCYFHLKDVAGTFERPRFGPNLREMGKGEIDFPAIMKILKDIKYKGWLNIEQDESMLPTPLQSATESMNYINKTLKPVYT